jgi:hypothetical protein
VSSVVVVTERCLVCPPQGALFINEGKCRVVQRNMAFKDGVAHGIDCLLTPPSLCEGRFAGPLQYRVWKSLKGSLYPGTAAHLQRHYPV